MTRFNGVVRLAIGRAIVGITAYAAFMFTVDVRCISASGKLMLQTDGGYLGFLAGLHDASARWIVTHTIADWRDETAWMSLT